MLIEAILGLTLFWLLIVGLASRFNLQKYGIFATTGLILIKISLFSRIFNRIGKWRIWKKMSNFLIYPTITIFYMFPVLLFANIILSYTSIPSPVILQNPVVTGNIESYILIIPAIMITLITLQIIKGIFTAAEGMEIEETGILFIVVIATIFTRIKKTGSNLSGKGRLRIISARIIVHLLIILLMVPIFYASVNITSGLYDPNPSAALVIGLERESPLQGSTIENGAVITELKIIEFNTIIQEIPITSEADFITSIRNLDPGTNLFIVTLGEQVNVQTDPTISVSEFLGIEVTNYREANYDWLPIMGPFWFETFLNWLINLNIIFAFFNLIPVPFSDGNEILDILTENSQIDTSAIQFIVLKVIIAFSAIINLLFIY